MSAAAITSSRFCARRLGVLRQLAILLLLLLPAVSASAIDIISNGGAMTITDNGAGDLNAAPNILQFNSFLAGYQMSGTLDLLTGASQSALLGSPTANLRLTNFVATAVGIPPNPLGIKFEHQFTGSFRSVVAGGSLDAYSSHATGLAIAPGTDKILD